ncbi:MAG: ATP-dependent RecD-like DNA helicase [Phototrophicales bacterium]
METFTGSVERITFYNDQNGYSVIKVRPDRKMPQYASRDGLVTVVGIMPELGIGEEVEFHGQWIEDPRYGMQMRVETVQPIQPTSRAGIIRYLSSGIVKGIGERRAEYIVDYFGDATLEILNKHPERLKEVPQIKPALAEALAEAWEQNVNVRQTMIFLQGYGVSSKMANRIHAVYGTETINKVKDNPYNLADEVHGIGFIKADSIARNMGMPFDAPERLRAGLGYALGKLSQDGHTYAPRQVLIDTTCDILQVDNPQLVIDALDAQLSANRLKADTLLIDGQAVHAIYLPAFYRAEQNAAHDLREIASMPSVITEAATKINWQAFLAELALYNNINLTEQQQSAVKAAFTSKVSVLTGGPGTGKTTTLQMVIAALERMDFSYALASPTGRAAKRLSEATNREAATIHRLFGFRPDEGFEFDADAPLKVDMLIIDEASMIDLMLFANVLRGISTETHLMLVGDVDQLPSVGAGNVLRDVINSGVAYVTRLDTIFRQEENSHIIINAHRVNNGKNPYLDNRSNDFFFFREEDQFKAAELLVEVVTQRIPRKFGFDPLMDIQVLSPMYRGASGVDKLNEALQHALNPGSIRRAEKKIGHRIFRVGDKVMQTRNNYEKDVFNGDIGFIRAIDDNDNIIEVHMGQDIIYYDYTEAADELIHAYCISIHRSQGSEYPVIVLPILTQHYMMLQRNLIYTAITRARDVVVMVGNRQAVQMAVRNNKVEKRYSGLLYRLTKPSGKLF